MAFSHHKTFTFNGKIKDDRNQVYLALTICQPPNPPCRGLKHSWDPPIPHVISSFLHGGSLTEQSVYREPKSAVVHYQKTHP